MHISSSQSQDQLVRGLTHRMNNILTMFHGYLGLMMDDQKLDAATRENLARIKDSASAASDLMSRTQALIRPSTIVWREINVIDLVQVLRHSFDSFKDPKTNITIDAPDELPIVLGDMTRVKNAILELVRNACEATAAAGGNVKIELRAEATSGSMDSKPTSAQQAMKWVVVRVMDDGPGIPADVEDKIYQPFFSTKHKASSAGLGLNVAAGFVEQIGGRLRHCTDSDFTCFELLLPARSDASV